MPTDAERIEALEDEVTKLRDRLDWTMFGVSALMQSLVTIVRSNNLTNSYVPDDLIGADYEQFDRIFNQIGKHLDISLKEQGIR